MRTPPITLAERLARLADACVDTPGFIPPSMPRERGFEECPSMMLVIGANGLTGSAVIRESARQHSPVRALIRSRAHDEC